ncbi:LiaF domain-containing protein [Candidatus Omnitrophota bacterium]
MLKKAAILSMCTIMFAGNTFCEHESSHDHDTVTIEKAFAIDENDVFKLDIDIDFADFSIKRSSSGNECSVFVDYDDNYDVSLKFNKKKNKLSLEVDREELFADKHHDSCESKKCGCDKGMVEVVIAVPFGPETEIDARMKAGEIDCRLGGLNLTRFCLRSWAGKTTVDFDEPNRSELKTLDINCSVGETEILSLGNARFRNAYINSGIGELEVNFCGETIGKAHARIDLDIGETKIVVPDDTGVRMKLSRFLLFSDFKCHDGFEKRGRYFYSDNYDECENRFELSVSSGIGDIEVKIDDTI